MQEDNEMKNVVLIKKDLEGFYIFFKEEKEGRKIIRLPLFHFKEDESIKKQIKKHTDVKRPTALIAGEEWIGPDDVEVYYGWVDSEEKEENEVFMREEELFKSYRRQVFGGKHFYKDFYLDQTSIYALAMYFLVLDIV